VSSRWLRQPEVDLVKLNKRIGARLRDWLPTRSGDPFDLKEWKQFEEWLHESLGEEFPEGNRLIVFEHADYAGLPWHVAAAPRWPLSYAPGWSTLLSLHQRATPATARSLGVVSVPRFGESAELVELFRTSTERSRQFAEAQSLAFLAAIDGAADADAVRDTLARSEVAKVLCHGFVSPAMHEVALMLAYRGSLPLRDSVMSATPEGMAHRMSWRECQSLPRTAGVVFSAACSTGLSHVAGLGERLGLFGALRHGGTRVVIAPRWDAWAPLVVPILDEALERYVVQGSSLGQALHGACLDASARLPRWLAWNLALEGDWR